MGTTWCKPCKGNGFIYCKVCNGNGYTWKGNQKVNCEHVMHQAPPGDAQGVARPRFPQTLDPLAHGVQRH
jgi:hypothetical protein